MRAHFFCATAGTVLGVGAEKHRSQPAPVTIIVIVVRSNGWRKLDLRPLSGARGLSAAAGSEFPEQKGKCKKAGLNNQNRYEKRRTIFNLRSQKLLSFLDFFKCRHVEFLDNWEFR